MRKHTLITSLAAVMTITALTGCGSANDTIQNTETQPEVKEETVIESEEAKEEQPTVNEEASGEIPDASVSSADDKIYEQFINDELKLDGKTFSEIFSFMQEDFNTDPTTFYYDVDEDGKDELLVTTLFYGYNIYDVRDGELLLLDCGDGTAAACGVYEVNGHVYVSHSDFSHAGRKMLDLTRYDQNGNVTETITINAEYWDSEDDVYDENSDFTYNGQKITMQEYEDHMNSLVFIDPDSANARPAP
ncbi:MAG: hypothetical protein K6G69_10830 [Lachnospiraceae bacterium]|nr:hypothetical protein [Lachnospiraceae bacterium]